MITMIKLLPYFEFNLSTHDSAKIHCYFSLNTSFNLTINDEPFRSFTIVDNKVVFLNNSGCYRFRLHEVMNVKIKLTKTVTTTEIVELN